MKTLLAATSILLLAGLSAACSNDNYSYAQVGAPVGDPAATVSLAPGGAVTLAEGSAVETQITLVAYNGDTLEGEITSQNTDILNVLPVADAGAYMFVGVSPGSTEVQITVDGREVETVPARVTALPESSMPAAEGH